MIHYFNHSPCEKYPSNVEILGQLLETLLDIAWFWIILHY